MAQNVTIMDSNNVVIGESGDPIFTESMNKGRSVTGYKSVTVNATAQEITKIASDRNYLRLCNMSSADDVFIGHNDSVTTGDGFPIFYDNWQDFYIDQNSTLYAIMSDNGSTADLRVLEAK